MSLRVSARLNDQGALVSSDLYDAYGQLRAGNPNNDPVGYCGQWGYYTDHSTGYILCTYRWYDPTTARWLTRDPIGYKGGINLYGYVGGNPVNGSDPEGLRVFKVTVRTPGTLQDHASPDHVFLLFTKYGGKVHSDTGWGYGFYGSWDFPRTPLGGTGEFAYPSEANDCGDLYANRPISCINGTSDVLYSADSKQMFIYQQLHPGDDRFEARLASIVQKSVHRPRLYSVLTGSVCWTWVDEMIASAERPNTAGTTVLQGP